MQEIMQMMFEFFGLADLETILTVGDLFLVLIKIAIGGGLIVFFIKSMFLMGSGRYRL